ncbi:MAG: hypothetical protein K6A05_03380 [Lachnospiraceae bacterium]|nr:hypothetical protein [Lachnospiraceae bacterium]
MDNYFKVSLYRSESEYDPEAQPTSGKRALSGHGDDFGKVFKTACDEVKQNQAAHTISRVLTLN